MKQLLQYLILLLLILEGSCNKERKSIIGGDITITGRILIPDTLSSNLVPLANVEVKLGLDSVNNSNFVLSNKTDRQGYFKFNNIGLTDRNYFLFVDYSLKTLNYERFLSAKQRLDFGDTDQNYTLILKPDSAYGKFLIKTKIVYSDLFSEVILPAHNCNLTVTALNSSTGQKKSTSNEDGIAYIDNMKEGSYLISATFTKSYSDIPITFKTDTTINLNTNRTDQYFELLLYPKTIAVLMTFVSSESPFTPQPNINYCLFSNRIFYLAGNCNGSNASGKSNPYGKTILGDFVPGAKYYVSAFDSLKSIRLIGKDSFFVAPNQITFKKIILK